MSGLRTLLTPEGVPLSLTLGELGQRLVAFALDLALLAVALLALTLAAAALGLGTRGNAATAIWVVGFFLLRNFWWVFFELQPRGATPGKRMLGLRVASRDGGRLTGDAILARNLVRELELFLPLTVLAVRGTNADWPLLALGLGWTGILSLFPLFNRDRLRVGDLLAGTWVVVAPRPLLLADLAAAPAPAPGDRYAVAFTFTPAQLRSYGEKELLVLEEVLRRADARPMAAVAARIRARIGWQRRGAETDATFLAAFYTGLRGELERGMVLGRRRRDKFDGA